MGDFNAIVDFTNEGRLDNDFTLTQTNNFVNRAIIEVANDFNATAIDFLNNSQIYVDNDFNATVTNNFGKRNLY